MGLALVIGALLVIALAMYSAYLYFPAQTAVVLEELDDILDDFNSKVERLEALALRKAVEAQKATEQIARLERERATLDEEESRTLKVKAKLESLLK